jgi:hypothetical protein
MVMTAVRPLAGPETSASRCSRASRPPPRVSYAVPEQRMTWCGTLGVSFTEPQSTIPVGAWWHADHDMVHGECDVLTRLQPDLLGSWADDHESMITRQRYGALDADRGSLTLSSCCGWRAVSRGGVRGGGGGGVRWLHGAARRVLPLGPGQQVRRISQSWCALPRLPICRDSCGFYTSHTCQRW